MWYLNKPAILKVSFWRKILLLKGENYQLEMNEAKKYWEINCDMHESVTNPTSKVFVINSVKRI